MFSILEYILFVYLLASILTVDHLVAVSYGYSIFSQDAFKIFPFIFLDLFIVYLIPYRLDLFLFILLKSHWNCWLQWYGSFITIGTFVLCSSSSIFLSSLFMQLLSDMFWVVPVVFHASQHYPGIPFFISLGYIMGSFLISPSSWGMESTWKPEAQLWVHSSPQRLLILR